MIALWRLLERVLVELVPSAHPAPQVPGRRQLEHGHGLLQDGLCLLADLLLLRLGSRVPAGRRRLGLGRGGRGAAAVVGAVVLAATGKENISTLIC